MVERLAAELDATKGSFYWHFANRAEVIAAAVELWERTATDEVIARVEAQTDPQTKLGLLFDEAMGNLEDGIAEVALASHRSEPVIAEAVARVTRRRVGYVTDLLVDIGFDPAEAERRATVIYASYLGYFHIATASPGLLDETPSHALKRVVTRLVTRDD